MYITVWEIPSLQFGLPGLRNFETSGVLERERQDDMKTASFTDDVLMSMPTPVPTSIVSTVMRIVLDAAIYNEKFVNIEYNPCTWRHVDRS